jgi:hypothetical protein
MFLVLTVSTFYPALPEKEIWSLSVFEIRRKSRKYSSVEIMFVRVGRCHWYVSLHIWSSYPPSQISNLVLWGGGRVFLHRVCTHCKSLYYHVAYHHNSPKFGTLQWHSSCAEELLLLRTSKVLLVPQTYRMALRRRDTILDISLLS